MQNIISNLTEASEFIIDFSVGIIKRLQAGFVDANTNYIKNSVANFVYNALENSVIFTTTQQENIKALEEYIINGTGTC